MGKWKTCDDSPTFPILQRGWPWGHNWWHCIHAGFRLIEYFEKQYGIHLIALEGASSALDPQIFRSFPDQKLLTKVFEQYMQDGELAGGPAAAIFSDRNASYYGIEDWNLYEQGIRHYLEAMAVEDSVMDKISTLKASLRDRKKKAYSKELFQLDQSLEDFYENHVNLPEILKQLAQIKLPPANSELAVLLEETERQGDEDSLSIEVSRLANSIHSYLKKNAFSKETRDILMEFNQKHQEFNTSRLTPEAFALYLKKVAANHKLPVRVSKALHSRTQKQQKLENIKGTKLFDDFEVYANEVKGSLLESEEAKRLNDFSERLRLIETFARLELSHDQWDEVKQLTGDNRQYIRNSVYLGSMDLSREELEILQMLEPHFRFYQVANERDEKFLNNLKSLMQKEDTEQLVMVCGGFHARHMARILEESGFSYLLLMPKINSIPEDVPYRQQMQGNVSWKEYFEIENGKINLYKAFVRAARDRLLKEGDNRLVKAWRDQIIRDLAEQNRIADSSRYTAYIDEVSGREIKSYDTGSKIITEAFKFADGLRKLHSSGNLTPENILQLLRPATTQVPYLVASFTRDAKVPVDVTKVQPSARPEIAPPGTGPGITDATSPASFRSEVRTVVSRELLMERLNAFKAEGRLESVAEKWVKGSIYGIRLTSDLVKKIIAVQRAKAASNGFIASLRWALLWAVDVIERLFGRGIRLSTVTRIVELAGIVAQSKYSEEFWAEAIGGVLAIQVGTKTHDDGTTEDVVDMYPVKRTTLEKNYKQGKATLSQALSENPQLSELENFPEFNYLKDHLELEGVLSKGDERLMVRTSVLFGEESLGNKLDIEQPVSWGEGYQTKPAGREGWIVVTLGEDGSFQDDPYLVNSNRDNEPLNYRRSEVRALTDIEAPAAISVQVADLKFGPEGIQILEVQSAVGSAFEGYKELYGEEMMDRVWEYIHSIRQGDADTGLRVLYVGEDLQVILGGEEYAKTRGAAALQKTGGIIIIGQWLDSVLKADELGFNQRKPGFDPSDLRTYTGVAILHSTLHSPEALDQIREQNPQLIELDRQGATAVFLGDKLLINTLFTGELEDARPKWRLFPKNYNPAELAQQIRQSLPSRSGKYIIKPIDSSRGRGVIPVEADQLEEVLTNIRIQSQNRKAVQEREKLEGFRFADGEKDPYEFWAVDTSPAILVEELAESKPVEVGGKLYDGTMRVVYVLTHDKTSGTDVKIIGSYWKLPSTAIGEGSLRDVILSRIHAEGAEGEDRVNSAKVSDADRAAVEKQLETVLPELYHRMLATKPEDAINRLLFSDQPEEVAYGIYLISRAREYSPERVERLSELAQERNPYYDAYLAELIRGIYDWNANINLIPVVAQLVNSDNPDARDVALKVALKNTTLAGMLNAAMARENNIDDITDLELRAEYINFLRTRGRITDEELLSQYETIFQEGEFESQKYILRTLFERQLILDENTNWLWAFLQNEHTQLYALWFNLYVENRNRLYDRKLPAAEREVRQQRRAEIDVLVKTSDLYENLPPERIISLFELVTYEQSFKRMEWYLNLLKAAYNKTGDSRLARMFAFGERNNLITQYGDKLDFRFGRTIFERFRAGRKLIDAFYNAGVVRDVISASQQAVRSLESPERRKLLIDELMRIPVGESYTDDTIDLLKGAIYKSGGVHMPLGELATEQKNAEGATVTFFLGIPIATKSQDGTVEKTLTRETAQQLLDNLVSHIASRADTEQPAGRMPPVVEETLQMSRTVSDALLTKQDDLAERLTERLRKLPEDENFSRNVEAAVIEIVEELAGNYFPLLNNYRDDGLLDFSHSRHLPGIEGEVSIASLLGVDISYWTRDQRQERKLFDGRQASTVALSILQALRGYIEARIPTQEDQEKFLNMVREQQKQRGEVRGEFNGVELRATGTESPEQIVQQFWDGSNRRRQEGEASAGAQEAYRPEQAEQRPLIPESVGIQSLAENAARTFVDYVAGNIEVTDSQLENFSAAVYIGANENIDEFLNNFIRAIESEAGGDAAEYVQDIIATMRGIAEFVLENYKNGGAFAVSPGDLSDEEQAAYYGKAAEEASAFIEMLYLHGKLGLKAQKAFKEAGVENLQPVNSLNGVSTIAFWHNFLPVLLPETARLEGNFRNTLLQIGIDYSNYEFNDLSQFEIALAAFVQFVVGYAAINELNASDVQILNRRQAGEKIDEKILQGIQGRLLSKLNQIPGISNVITGFMNGTPNILLSQIQNFVTQYRSEQRIKAAA